MIIDELKMQKIKIKIDEPTLLQNAWQRIIKNHHAKKRELVRWAWLVRSSLKNIPQNPIELSNIVIHRYCAGTPDWDGLYGGLKPLLDVLVVQSKRNPQGLGIIRDDSIKHIKDLKVIPHYAPPKKGYSIIEINELQDDL